MRRLSSMIAFAISTWMVVSSSVSGDELAIREFLENYPKAAENLESAYGAMQGKCKIMMQNEPNAQQFYIQEGSFFINGNSKKVVISATQAARPTGNTSKVEHNPVVEEVFCLDDRSFFRLEKRANDQGYIVRSLGSKTHDINYFKWNYIRLLVSPYSILGEPVRKIMAGPGFRIESATKSVEKNAQL